MDKWQPIETAPKDGTAILVSRWRPDLDCWQSPVAMLWMDERKGWFYSGTRFQPIGPPEIWHPMPALPEGMNDGQ